MLPRRLALGLLLALPATLARAAAPETVSFPASDGIIVHGDLYRPVGAPRGVLLLFHQAGSSRLEYAPIAPKLAALGWLALAIDQRSGGDLFGGRNLTAEAVPGASYTAALPDLEAALAWARKQWPGLRPAVWGSSYSAALVFVLAARHPDAVSAVLAFSPGEYLSSVSVQAAARQVTVPVYVTSASDADEEAAAATILAASPAAVKRQERARNGVHGSATLRPDTNPAGAAANFAAVARFLNALPPG